MDRIKFTEKFRFYLQQKEMTESKVAEVLHVTPATINKWMMGEAPISLLNLHNLCSLFDLNEADCAAFFTLAGREDYVKATGDKLIQDRIALGLQIGVPHQAPLLRTDYVPRSEIYNKLTGDLYSYPKSNFEYLVVSDLDGLGGSGKSTLIAQLAHDPAQRRFYPDGVLWATLGSNPDTFAIVNDWLRALEGHQTYQPSVEAATAQLRKILGGKIALLVVDDVRNEANLQPFLIAGSRCRTVITTRDQTIATRVGAKQYKLDRLTHHQALEIIARGLGRPLSPDEQRDASAVAETVGYLPLALQLVVPQIVLDGLTWPQLLTALHDDELGRLATQATKNRAGEPDPNSIKRLSVRAVCLLSLKRLSDVQRRAFAWLAVLPPHINFTAEMVTTLWDTDRQSAQRILLDLLQRGLVLPGAAQADGSLTFRQNALLHDLALELLTSSSALPSMDRIPGLGFDLPGAHAALLARYHAKTTAGLWHTLEPDGYIHDHLSWHMEQAGQVELIDALIREENSQGRNGWYLARARLAQVNGYIRDVARANGRAEKMMPTGGSQAGDLALGQQIRYTLIQASLKAIDDDLIPVKLLIALVREGIWRFRLKFGSGYGVTYSEKSAEAIVQLAPHLSKAELSQALDGAMKIEEARYCAKAVDGLIPYLSEIQLSQLIQTALNYPGREKKGVLLTSLVPHIPEAERHEVLSAALAATLKMDPVYDRSKASALARIGPYLSESQLQQALEAIQNIEGEEIRARALLSLGQHLPAAQRQPIVNQVLEIALNPEDSFDPFFQAETIPEVAAYVSGPPLNQLFETALTLPVLAQLRARTLARLIPYLPASLQQTAISRAYEDVLSNPHEHERRFAVDVVALLAPHLSYSQLDQMVETIISVGRLPLYTQAKALIALVPYLSEKQLNQALEAIRFQSKNDRIELLSRLVEHLPEPQRDEILKQITPEMPKRYETFGQAWIWLNVIEYLTERQRDEVLRQVYHSIPTIIRHSQPLFIAEELTELAEYLSQPQRNEVLHQALDMAVRIYHPQIRVKAWASFGPYLSEDQRNGILAQISHMPEKWFRAEAVIGMAEYLPTDQLDQALAIVADISSEWDRSKALISLAKHLSEPQRNQAFALALSLKDSKYLSEALVGLIEVLSEPQRRQAFTVALEINNESAKAYALAGLAPYLSDTQLQQALVAARKLQGEYDRATALRGLIKHLPPSQKYEVLEQTLGIVPNILNEDRYRVELLADLAGHVSEERREAMLAEALEIALEISSEVVQLRCLSHLVGYLSETQLPRVLQATLNRHFQEQYLPEILNILVSHMSESELDQALRITLDTGYYLYRLQGLLELAPHLSQRQLERALETAHAFEHEQSRLLAVTALRLYHPTQRIEDMMPMLVAALQHVPLSMHQNPDKWLEIVLRGWVPHLCALPLGSRIQFFRQVLARLSRHPRPRVYEIIAILAPLIASLGDTVLSEMVAAMEDVERWWP